MSKTSCLFELTFLESAVQFLWTIEVRAHAAKTELFT